MCETRVRSLDPEDPLEKEMATHSNTLAWKIPVYRNSVEIENVYPLFWASQIALVKNVPAVQETRVRSLSWEDPLEKEMATHSNILAWKISWTEEPGGLQSMGSQRVGHN